MKKTLQILALVLMLGILLPSSVYSCNIKTENSCCKKENTTKNDKKNCCNNKDSKQKERSCNGKCGHSNCTNSNVNFSLMTVDTFEFKINEFRFTTKKSKYHYHKTVLSSGFVSVWLPPKI